MEAGAGPRAAHLKRRTAALSVLSDSALILLLEPEDRVRPGEVLLAAPPPGGASSGSATRSG